MKVVTCSGYFASGSSALMDLISEYISVYEMGDYEFRFLHDIDGVSDLEFHLVECHNRHNSGHALKRFKKLSKFNAGGFYNKRYEPFFQDKYWRITEEYIDKLTEFEYVGWWFYDLYDRGKLYYYFMQLINHVVSKLPSKPGILRNTKTFCSHPTEEFFIETTREYVRKLLEAANRDNKPFLEIDQLLPTQNINRIMRYIGEEVRLFIVDRDPRDVYALEKLYLHEQVCPFQDVNEFCRWYRYTHNAGNREEYDAGKIMKINFEDLVYNYWEKLSKIEAFVGLEASDHANQFLKFNPCKSVNNTKIWQGKGIDEEIAVIEQELREYLYDFNKVENSTIAGIAVDSKKVF